MSDRIIFHADCNNLFASCECLERPELCLVPMAVAGDSESRKGVVVAKNELAKKAGVKTTDTVYQAQRKCPGIVFVPPRHHFYSEISKRVNAIYLEHTDLVEPASIDESYILTILRRLGKIEISLSLFAQTKSKEESIIQGGIPMMKKFTALLLCALLALAPALAEGGVILDGRWLNADLQGNVTEDTPAELKDDFGLFVNKDWILQAEIPAGESLAGAMEDAERTLMDRQIALMKDESLTGHDAELVRKLYALVSDWDYRNTQGVEPAMPTIEAIQGIDSLETLTNYLYDRNNLLRFYPLTMAVGADYTNPDIYMTQIATPSLMLKDSAEYTERTQAGEL